MMPGAKGSTAHNCQNCLRLRSQVALRIVKSAKCVTKNPNSLRSNMRIFCNNASLSILRATKAPVDDKQF